MRSLSAERKEDRVYLTKRKEKSEVPDKGLSIKYYRHNGTVLIRAIGSVLKSTSSNLIRPVLGLLKKGVTSLVLDLTQVSSIDASGVETLEEANDLMSALLQPPLRIVVKPDSRVDHALNAAGVREDFRIYDSAESAWGDTGPGEAPVESLEKLDKAGEEMYLSVSREERGDVVVFSLHGEIDIEEVRDLKRILLRDLEAGHTKIVLDMDQVRFVDSSALGLFATIGRRFRETGGDLRFARLSEQTQRIFSVFRLEQIYQCFKTINGAVKSYELS